MPEFSKENANISRQKVIEELLISRFFNTEAVKEFIDFANGFGYARISKDGDFIKILAHVYNYVKSPYGEEIRRSEFHLDSDLNPTSEISEISQNLSPFDQKDSQFLIWNYASNNIDLIELLRSKDAIPNNSISQFFTEIIDDKPHTTIYQCMLEVAENTILINVVDGRHFLITNQEDILALKQILSTENAKPGKDKILNLGKCVTLIFDKASPWKLRQGLFEFELTQ